MPSSLTGYDHDVFLSFAGFDDRGAGEGWVQVLRGRLAAELLHRLGHGVLVDAAGAVDDAAVDAASRSAVLVVLLSGSYLRKVGARHVDERQLVGGAGVAQVAGEQDEVGRSQPPCRWSDRSRLDSKS